MIFKNVMDFWRTGFVKRYSNHIGSDNKMTMKDIFNQYRYSVNIYILNYMEISEFQEMEEFCQENFGKLDEYDPKCQWQVCSHERIEFPEIGPVKIKPILIFLFHNEDDAMAFKLRWI